MPLCPEGTLGLGRAGRIMGSSIVTGAREAECGMKPTVFYCVFHPLALVPPVLFKVALRAVFSVDGLVLPLYRGELQCWLRKKRCEVSPTQSDAALAGGG